MFQASIHGWPFGNDYECSGPELGTGGPPPPELGMGGGLCWSALDRYVRGASIPRHLDRPAPGDPLHAELYQRQVAALAGLWPEIRDWSRRPSGSWRDRLPFPVPGGDDLASRTRRSWRDVRRSLAAGEPVLLTLLPRAGGYDRPRTVRQVLATRASRDGLRARITVYDPDQPGNDRVHVKLNLAGSLDARTSDGQALRGFFPVPYDRTLGAVIRLESFDDRSVIGLNRAVLGRPSMVAKRGRLDLVARNPSGALVHFYRVRSRHWESTNVTEVEGFGTHELHTDPVAVRAGGALHVFALDHMGDLLHFWRRRSWRVRSRTAHKRVGAQFRLRGRVVPVVGPRRSLSVLGRDPDGGLVHYHRTFLRGWRAEQVAGEPLASAPVAGLEDDVLHVVGTDGQGRVLHWRRRSGWTMTDSDAGDGPVVRLAGEPQLLIRDGSVRILGRTAEDELAIMTLGQDGRWVRLRLGRRLSGDPRVTEGPAGIHVFAPAGRRGLIHAWRQDGEWVWEDIVETRPALLGTEAGEPELACWGSATELRVFERRGATLRALSWQPDADWNVDPLSSRVGSRPDLVQDHQGLPHVFLTDRWGTVMHVEKGEWREPGRSRPAPASTDVEPVETEPVAVTETGDEGGPAGEPEPLEGLEGLEDPEPEVVQEVEPLTKVEDVDRREAVARLEGVERFEAVDPEIEAVEAADPVEAVAPAGDEVDEAHELPLLEFDDEEGRAAAPPPEPPAERSADDDDFPFIDFEEDEEEAAMFGAIEAEDDLPYLEVEGEPEEELPFLDDDAPMPMEKAPAVETEHDEAADASPAASRAEPRPSEPERSRPEPPESEPQPSESEPERVLRRVKGGPGGTVDVEPMDLSLLDSWPDTSQPRRKKRESRSEGPKSGGGPSSRDT